MEAGAFPAVEAGLGAIAESDYLTNIWFGRCWQMVELKEAVEVEPRRIITRTCSHVSLVERVPHATCLSLFFP